MALGCWAQSKGLLGTVLLGTGQQGTGLLGTGLLSTGLQGAPACGPSDRSHIICPQAGARSSACRTYYLRTLFATADPRLSHVFAAVANCMCILFASSILFALLLLHIVCSNNLS